MSSSIDDRSMMNDWWNTCCMQAESDTLHCVWSNDEWIQLQYIVYILLSVLPKTINADNASNDHNDNDNYNAM